MGSHSELTIENVLFDKWKDWIGDSIMILFSEKEKIVEEIPLPSEFEHLLEEGETSPFFSVKYVSTVETLKKRLDFLGFTLDTTRRVFEIGRVREIEDVRSRIEKLSKTSLATEHRELSQVMTNQNIRRMELLELADSDRWLAALREAFLAPENVDHTNLSELANSFRPFRPNAYDRFPHIFDERFRLRFELEAFQTGEAVYDVSELVNIEECCSSSDPLTEFARESVGSRDRQALHLIVLTEGSTDKFVLENALRILKPELREYVSFMDFAGLNVEGGASFLASIVRAFAGAGVRDRVVAVFDNDTAGCLSQSLISKHDLPDNIRIIRYPDIDIAKNYPTIGPSGLVNLDINNSAAGIEIYLGSDVLTEPDGSLMPIQWKGFEAKLGRYQGEMLDKRGCLRRFTKKLHKFDREGGDPHFSGWGDLGAIIEAICSAFRSSDAEFLIESERELIN
jgi:hypothetical protein